MQKTPFFMQEKDTFNSINLSRGMKSCIPIKDFFFLFLFKRKRCEDDCTRENEGEENGNKALHCVYTLRLM